MITEERLQEARQRIAVGELAEELRKSDRATWLAEEWVLTLATAKQIEELLPADPHQAASEVLRRILTVDDIERLACWSRERWDEAFDLADRAWAHPFLEHAHDVAKEVRPAKGEQGAAAGTARPSEAVAGARLIGAAEDAGGLGE